MDLLPMVKAHLTSGKKVIFAGTDPGTVVTTVTVPKTLESVLLDINRFSALMSVPDGDTLPEGDPSHNIQPLEPLPKPHKFTAGFINNVTFSRKHQKRRERRAKLDVDKKVCMK